MSEREESRDRIEGACGQGGMILPPRPWLYIRACALGRRGENGEGDRLRLTNSQEPTRVHQRLTPPDERDNLARTVASGGFYGPASS